MLEKSHNTHRLLLPYGNHWSFIPQTFTESLQDPGFFPSASSQGYIGQERDRNGDKGSAMRSCHVKRQNRMVLSDKGVKESTIEEGAQEGGR